MLADAGDDRYDRAATRLVERAAAELKAQLADVALVACALAVLPGARDKAAIAQRSAELLETLGC